jgi:hypothetical protein
MDEELRELRVENIQNVCLDLAKRGVPSAITVPQSARVSLP